MYLQRLGKGGDYTPFRAATSAALEIVLCLTVIVLGVAVAWALTHTWQSPGAILASLVLIVFGYVLLAPPAS